MNVNPYATPPDAAVAGHSPIHVPAILLICLSFVSAVIWILGGMMSILSLASRDDPRFVFYGLIDIVLGLINLMLAGGAVAVLRGASRRIAWATAIAAIVPCISPCVVLGLPLGIWMMVALRSKPP